MSTKDLSTIDAGLARAIRQHALLRDVARLGLECDRLIEEESFERLAAVMDERTRLLAAIADLAGQADVEKLGEASRLSKEGCESLGLELRAIGLLVEEIERDDAARFERIHARRDRCARELRDVVAAGRAAAAYGRTETATARSEDRRA